MSDTVDDRVVGLKFDNKAFEEGAAASMTTLQKLKESFNMSSATNAASRSLGFISTMLGKFGITNPFSKSAQGVAELQTAVNGFNMNPMATTIQGVSGKFLALSTVAITAISNITNKVIDSATRMAKSFTLDPVLQGFKEYELQINSTKTILSNVAQSGAGLKDVEKALDDLNHYADKTIYNFTQMTDSIGKFTAAGVDLDTATASIKGIANMAALGGASASDASRAMYQLSQAISAGKISLMDWKSVENANMATAQFKDALTQTAVAMGKLDKSSVETVGKMKNVRIEGQSFRESIMAKPGEESWLSSDVLTSTLEVLTGDLTDAQLKARGYTTEQIKAIQLTAKMGVESATQVRTFSGMMDTLKEGVVSGWAQTFRILGGNLTQATKLWSGVSEVIGGFFQGIADRRNELLKGWKKLGGRDVLLDGIATGLKAISNWIKPVISGFRDIFPRTTAKQLFSMTQSFAELMKQLKPSDAAFENLRKISAGFFATLGIGWEIVKQVASVIGDLFGVITSGSGSMWNFAGGLGDFMVSLHEAIKNGQGLTKFFDGLSSVLQIPFKLLVAIGSVLGSLFGGFDSSGANEFSESIASVGDRLSPLELIGRKVEDILSGLGGRLKNLGSNIGKALGGVGEAIASAFGPNTFDKVLDAINTGLLAALVLSIKQFMDGGLNVDVGGGFFENVKNALNEVTDTLVAMQVNLKADTLLKIAGALGIMAASIVALAMLDPKKLTKAMGALSAGFFGMQAAMVSLVAAVGIIGTAKLPILAGSMVLLATSLAIFAGAVALMGAIPFDNIVRGLIGIGGVLLIIKKFIESLDTKGIVRASVAMTLLGVALNLMATALSIFATLSWEEMARGLVAMAGTLAVVAGAMRLMPKGMIKQAAAILILSVAINALGVALKIFATLSWEEMARGLVSLAGALLIIAGAMHIMPKGMLLQAIALNVVAASLITLSQALQSMGGMTWEQIGKGLVTLAGALLILAGALYLMSGTMSGAAALIIAAGALSILAPILVTLGGLEWSTILKGLVALAALFAVLGLAAYLLTPVIPAMLGLGAALVLLGAGLALIGAAALAFTMAFGVLVGLGYAGVKMLADIIGTFIAAIPGFMVGFAKGLGAFAEEISKHGPSYVKAMGVILSSFLETINKAIPKIGKLFLTLLRTALRVIARIMPEFYEAGLELILGFLEAIERKVPRIVTTAANIVIKFLDTLASKMPKIVQSGVNLLISFLDGIATAIEDPINKEKIRSAAVRIGEEIIKGALKGLNAGKELIVNAAKDVGGWALGAIKRILGIKSPSREFIKIGKFVNEGFVQGLKGSEADVISVMEEMGTKVKESIDASAMAIDDLSGKLKDLKKAKREAAKDKNPKNDKKYNKEIKKTEAALEEAKKEMDRAKKIRELLKGDLKDEQVELRKLGQEYDRNAKSLEEYEAKLKDLESTRDQVKSKFNVTPDISRNTSITSYLRNANREKEKVTEFNQDLQTLLSMGLDKDSYNKLLEEGLDAQPFIDKLIAAGPAMVTAFNSANEGLEVAATNLGTNASATMHGVGIDTVQGLISGLKTDQERLKGEMERIGQIMVDAIKKKLKIKSPSRAFMEIGKFSNEGLAQGLKSYSGAVQAAAGDVGAEALDTLRISMTRAGEVMSANMDMNPVIAPVLDLTQLQKDASQISGLLPEAEIVGQTSYRAAAAVSEATSRTASDANISESNNGGGDTFEYTQIINSPRALSEIDIFRGTRNQLSMKKEELKLK